MSAVLFGITYNDQRENSGEVLSRTKAGVIMQSAQKTLINEGLRLITHQKIGRFALSYVDFFKHPNIDYGGQEIKSSTRTACNIKIPAKRLRSLLCQLLSQPNVHPSCSTHMNRCPSWFACFFHAPFPHFIPNGLHHIHLMLSSPPQLYFYALAATPGS